VCKRREKGKGKRKKKALLRTQLQEYKPVLRIIVLIFPY
jgi:hypothetical protein